MEKYYMVIDGQRVGPLPLYDLAARGLRPDTLVWRSGMQTWEPAHTLPELNSILNPPEEESAFGTYAEHIDITPPPSSTQPYADPQRPYDGNHQSAGRQPYNWQTLAIIGIVCGVFFGGCIGAIFGIIGLNYARKANRLYARNFEAEAYQANMTAKTMTIISLVFSGLGLLVSGLSFYVPLTTYSIF